MATNRSRRRRLRPTIHCACRRIGDRLLDADGTPFLVQGDAAWSLIANVTYEEAIAYLDDRQAKGFNTLIVSIVEHLFSRQAPRDRAGNEPFTATGDMSNPNEVYFDHAERVLEACAERGIAVILACCYIGHRHDPSPGVEATNHAEGWYYEVVGTGVDGCRRYGEYLGRRFGRFTNIIWCIGGDWNPDEARDGLDAIAAGIRSQGVTNLFTAHVRPETSAVDAFAGSDWLDVDFTYSYGIVHRSLLADWQRVPVMAVPAGRVDLRGRAQCLGAPDPTAGVVVGAVRGERPLHGQQPHLAVLGWLAGSTGPAGIRAMAAGALSSGRCRGRSWCPTPSDASSQAGWARSRGLDRVTPAMTPDGRLGVGVSARAAARDRRPGCAHGVSTSGCAGSSQRPGRCDRVARSGRRGGDPRSALHRGFGAHPGVHRWLTTRRHRSAEAPWPSSPSPGRSRRRQLGLTLPHEHMFCDTSPDYREPPPNIRELLAALDVDLEAPITLSSLGFLRREPQWSVANQVLDSYEDARDEWAIAMRVGIRGVIDCTPIGLGRRPSLSRRLAQELGLAIVGATGYYRQAFQPADVADMSVAMLEERFLREVTEGMDRHGRARGAHRGAGHERRCHPAQRGAGAPRRGPGPAPDERAGVRAHGRSSPRGAPGDRSAER